MTTKATIVLSEQTDEEGNVHEFMEINYEVEKDEEGNVILRSNVIGYSRLIMELFKYGVLLALAQGFVPKDFKDAGA